MNSEQQPAAVRAAPIRCAPDAGFANWLAASGGSLAVSTYQAGQLLLIGCAAGQLTLLMRQYDKPMGLDVAADRLVLASRSRITLHVNDPVLAHHYRAPGRYDALYLPRLSWHTGDLAVHDVAFGAGDEVWLVNTRFSCLARVSARHSFAPAWHPAFVSALAPDDRCHLNGLAMLDGEPAYVTCLAESDTPAGWRARKADGGVLIDVRRNETLVRGLSMPHSPRWHRGNLYVLNSGAGELLRVDPHSGSTEVVCTLPGYLRGLTFVDDNAVVGLCRIRESEVFGGMAVQSRHAQLECGVAVIALASGACLGRFEFTAGCEELFDVRFLAGARCANVFSPEKPEALEAYTAPAVSWWLHHVTGG